MLHALPKKEEGEHVEEQMCVVAVNEAWREKPVILPLGIDEIGVEDEFAQEGLVTEGNHAYQNSDADNDIGNRHGRFKWFAALTTRSAVILWDIIFKGSIFLYDKKCLKGGIIGMTELMLEYFNFVTMKDFKKYYIVPAPPEEVYLALTFQATIELWTGDKAQMRAEPGSEFSLWDGAIVGKNIEFVPGKKIVQQWYFGEQEEESIVTIKLHADDVGTSVEVRQTNIPDDDYDDIVQGWNETYFDSLIEFYS